MLAKMILSSAILFSGGVFAADLMVQPASLNFYSVQLGQSQAGSINIYNFGDTDLGITINDYCYGDIWISTYCPWSLRPGQSCSINAQFRPSRAGYQSCSVTVTSDNGGYENVSVGGQGVSP